MLTTIDKSIRFCSISTLANKTHSEYLHHLKNIVQPSSISTSKNINCKNQCRYEFGTYVQCNSNLEPTNTNEPRTPNAVYFRPNSLTTGHILMDLQTGHQIQRNTVCPLPMTTSVITRVNDIGKAQNITKLYFKNCNRCCMAASCQQL